MRVSVDDIIEKITTAPTPVERAMLTSVLLLRRELKEEMMCVWSGRGSKDY